MLDVRTERPRVADGRSEDVRASLLALRQRRMSHRDDAEPAEPPPPDPLATIRRYAEPLIKERGANPNGSVWHLMSVVGDMREGAVASAHRLFPWSQDQIEALWNNLANAWPLGSIVAIDLTGQPQAPWPEHFGPYPTNSTLVKRTLIAAGAEKLAAIAWSLSEPPTPYQERIAPEETAIWSRYQLVADADLRRIRFVCGKHDPLHQLPVRLLPDTGPCIKALNAMEVTPVEREWLNRTARRLSETYLSVHLFPYRYRDDAEAMIANLRRIEAL